MVVGVDGSDPSDHALEVSARMAAGCDARLTVAHADESDHPDTALLERCVATASEQCAKVRSELLSGPPARELIDLVFRTGADLLALGAWGLGHSERFMIGSVPHRASHHAPSDVLVVAEHEDSSAATPVWDRVLIATDGSPTADRAARRGFQLAGVLGADVTLMFVGHPETGELVLNDTVATSDVGIPVRLRIEQGHPAERILESAEEEGARLIIVGNRGMSGAKRFLLGSVPQSVVEYAGRDVLIVRTVTQELAEIRRGEGGVVVQAGEKVAAYRGDGGELHGVSATCTHMGCTVGWNGADRTWDCPCHGSRFSVDGEVVNGPAKEPLARVDLES